MSHTCDVCGYEGDEEDFSDYEDFISNYDGPDNIQLVWCNDCPIEED